MKGLSNWTRFRCLLLPQQRTLQLLKRSLRQFFKEIDELGWNHIDEGSRLFRGFCRQATWDSDPVTTFILRQAIPFPFLHGSLCWLCFVVSPEGSSLEPGGCFPISHLLCPQWSLFSILLICVLPLHWKFSCSFWEMSSSYSISFSPSAFDWWKSSIWMPDFGLESCPWIFVFSTPPGRLGRSCYLRLLSTEWWILSFVPPMGRLNTISIHELVPMPSSTSVVNSPFHISWEAFSSKYNMKISILSEEKMGTRWEGEQWGKIFREPLVVDVIDPFRSLCSPFLFLLSKKGSKLSIISGSEYWHSRLGYTGIQVSFRHQLGQIHTRFVSIPK